MLANNAIKAGLISMFFWAGLSYVNDEMASILASDLFNEACPKPVEGKLKIVCKIIENNGLNLHQKEIRKLLINNGISNADKISLLKIKLDFIINGDYPGRTKFFVLCILAGSISLITGVGGLALFLSALFQLLQEGKIKRALYIPIKLFIQQYITNGTEIDFKNLDDLP